MTCRICGAELPEGAMFCGDCGSSTSATPETRRRMDPRPGDTTAFPRPSPRSGVISVPLDGFHAVRQLRIGEGDDAHAGRARCISLRNPNGTDVNHPCLKPDRPWLRRRA